MGLQHKNKHKYGFKPKHNLNMVLQHKHKHGFTT